MSEQKQVGAERVMRPLSAEWITDEIAFKALKAVESRKAVGRSLQATAEMYAAYTIIRERELEAALTSRPEPPSAELLRAATAVLDLWDDDTAILNDGKLEGNDAAADQACDSFRDLRAALSRAESAGPVRTYKDGVRDALQFAEKRATTTRGPDRFDQGWRGSARVISADIRALLPEGEKATAASQSASQSAAAPPNPVARTSAGR